MLLQTKLVPPLLSVLLASVILASLLPSKNTAAAHEVTRVQPLTRRISSMRSTSSMLLCAQLNQSYTWCRMYSSNSFVLMTSSWRPPLGRDKSAPRPLHLYLTPPTLQEHQVKSCPGGDNDSLVWCRSLHRTSIYLCGDMIGVVFFPVKFPSSDIEEQITI